MTTEGIGGTCPNCQYGRTFYLYCRCASRRWPCARGSSCHCTPDGIGWFLYDLCPKCGFAYGTACDEEYTAEEVIKAVLDAHGLTGLDELLAFAEARPDSEGRLKHDMGCDTVFAYDKKVVLQFRQSGVVYRK